MALSDPIVTSAEYHNHVKKVDMGSDEAIDEDLQAIYRMIVTECRREFGSDDEVVQRKFMTTYRGGDLSGVLSGVSWAESENPWRWLKGDRILYVDDLADEPTEVLLDRDRTGLSASAVSLVLDADYQLWPLNAALGGEARPYTRLMIPTWSSQSVWTPQAMVWITAKWGWPTPPAAVKRACIELTAILRLETPRATTQIQQLADLSSMSREAQTIIWRLQRNYKKSSSII